MIYIDWDPQDLGEINDLLWFWSRNNWIDINGSQFCVESGRYDVISGQPRCGSQIIIKETE